MPEPEASPHPSGGIGATLSRHYGPLPLWGWSVVGVAGVILLLRYRAARATTGARTATLPVGAGNLPSNAAGGYGSGFDLTGLSQQLTALQTRLGGTTVGAGGGTGSATIAAYGQQHWFTLDPAGNLVHRWTTGASGSTASEILGGGLPAGSTVNVTQNGDSLVVNVLDSLGNIIYSTTYAAGSGWSGGAQSAPQPGGSLPTNGSGGVLSGGNPAPVSTPPLAGRTFSPLPLQR
jgi:hypothetical protein